MSPRYSIIPADAIGRLKGIEMEVLLVLGTHTNNRGWAEIRQVAIAERLSYSREAVNRAIKQLCELGYVEKAELSGPGRGCAYRVILDRGQPDEPQDLVVTQGSQGGGDVIPTSQGMCAPDHTPCDPLAVTQERTLEKRKRKARASESSRPAATPQPQALDRPPPAKAGASLEPYELACRLIDPDQAQLARQEGCLGRLFDFVVKRGELPDVWDMQAIRRDAAAATADLEANGQGKVIAASLRRQDSILRDITEKHQAMERAA